MTHNDFACGTHAAQVFKRGGEVVVGDLTPLSAVRWSRVRDDVSSAVVDVPVLPCWDLLNKVRTILHELHIFRNGEKVWEGPITRIEYEWDRVRIYAEDVLWQTKRTVLEVGYDQSYPALGDVVDRMDWLLRDQTYNKYGDPWNVVPHLNPVTHAGGPQTTRKVEAYSMYVWEDLDKYAEDAGADYTVVNRDIYYWDLHLAWATLPPLDEHFLSQFPRVVEYGYQLATRAFVTDGSGFAGQNQITGPLIGQDQYGIVDLLINNNSEGTRLDTGPPSAGDLARWAATAANALNDGRAPAPVDVVIPANTTLMPGAPWTVETMIPGAWFQVTIERMCRTIVEWQRLNEVVVTEGAPNGEEVNFSASSAPEDRVDP